MLDMAKGAPQAPFIQSTTFTGAKPGYYFSKGERGLGYYLDAKQQSVPASLTDDDPETFPAVGQKRKLQSAGLIDSLDENNPGDIDAYIANAERNNTVEALTSESLPQVCYVLLVGMLILYLPQYFLLLILLDLVIIREKNNEESEDANEICGRTG